MGKTQHTRGRVYINGIQQGIGRFVSQARLLMEPELLTRSPQVQEDHRICPQDDIVLPELTVRENILHSARMRLPLTWKEPEIQAHVDALLQCLSLDQVQHSLVGDSMKPVDSGGQRKRVSIGIELAAASMALFLDESTSGLDATFSLSVMKLLKALSRLGVTVVTIIHQPRTEIFDCLDNVMLLAEGRQVFRGKTQYARGYFENLGFQFSINCSPADTIMDIISGQGYKYCRYACSMKILFLVEQWARFQHFYCRVSIPSNYGQEPSLRRCVAQRGAKWYKQVWYCFLRSVLQQVRQAMSFYLELFVCAVAGLLIGLAVSDLKGVLFTGIYRAPYQALSSATNYTLIPQLGMLNGLGIGLAGSAPGVKIFGEEKLKHLLATVGLPTTLGKFCRPPSGF